MLRDRGRTRALAERGRVRLRGDHGLGRRRGRAPRRGGARRTGRRPPRHVNRLVDDFDPSVTFDDLARFGEWSGLPVVVKGVMRGDDARRCVDAGAAAIAVSNHGGRIVDGCIDTATGARRRGRCGAGPRRDPRRRRNPFRHRRARAPSRSAPAPSCSADRCCGASRSTASRVRAPCSTSFAQDLRRTMAFCGAASLAGIDRDLLVPDAVAAPSRAWAAGNGLVDPCP